MAAMQPATRYAALDALAAVQSRLAGDGEALRVILDHGDTRAVAAVLADITARLLAGQSGGDGSAGMAG